MAAGGLVLPAAASHYALGWAALRSQPGASAGPSPHRRLQSKAAAGGWDSGACRGAAHRQTCGAA